MEEVFQGSRKQRQVLPEPPEAATVREGAAAEARRASDRILEEERAKDAAWREAAKQVRAVPCLSGFLCCVLSTQMCFLGRRTRVCVNLSPIALSGELLEPKSGP